MRNGQKRTIQVSLLPHDRSVVLCENDVACGSSDTHCVVSVGNVEQLSKLRQLSVSTSAFTAIRQRLVDNAEYEVVLGRGDGVVELWRQREGEWKAVLSTAVSDGAIRCVEFLNSRREADDRVSDGYTSHLLVVAADGVSVLVVPANGGTNEHGGRSVQRLSLDLFYGATVRNASATVLNGEHVLIGYEDADGTWGAEDALKVAHVRIEPDEEQSLYYPKRIQLVERFVLPISTTQFGTVRAFAFTPRDGEQLPDVLVVALKHAAKTQSATQPSESKDGNGDEDGLAVLRFEVAKTDRTEGAVDARDAARRYKLTGTFHWQTQTQPNDLCDVTVGRQPPAGSLSRTYALVSSPRRLLLLDVYDGSSMRQLADLHVDGCVAAQLDNGSLDCAARLVRQTRTGVEVSRVSLLRFAVPDRDARTRQLADAFGTLAQTRPSANASHSAAEWVRPHGGLAELLRVMGRAERDLLRRAIEESLPLPAPKLGTAAYFGGVRLLFAKTCLDALGTRVASPSPSASPSGVGETQNALALASALQVWLFVQLVQMHALLIRVATVTCQFETGGADAQAGAENRFDKPQSAIGTGSGSSSGTLFNVAQLVHEAASQHASVDKLFEIVDNTVSVLSAATLTPPVAPRRTSDEQEPENEPQDEPPSSVADQQPAVADVHFASRFVRFLVLFLIEHALGFGSGSGSGSSKRSDLRLFSLPLFADKVTLQLVREYVTCIHLLAQRAPGSVAATTTGSKRTPLPPAEQHAFNCVCEAVSLLSACTLPEATVAAGDQLVLPANCRAELLAIRTELRDAHFTVWLNANLVCFSAALRHAAATETESNELSASSWISVSKTRSRNGQGGDTPTNAKRRCVRPEREAGGYETQWDAVWCRPLRDERAVLTCTCCGALTTRSRLHETAGGGKLYSIWSLRCTKSCPLCDGRWILD